VSLRISEADYDTLRSALTDGSVPVLLVATGR
jgi:hypothetical protein